MCEMVEDGLAGLLMLGGYALALKLSNTRGRLLLGSRIGCVILSMYVSFRGRPRFLPVVEEVSLLVSAGLVGN